MIKWRSTNLADIKIDMHEVVVRNGYCFLGGREGLIYKKSLRQRISAKKTEIAKRAAKILSLVPGIKMVAVTGSLAMENSDDESDIDLMIVTKTGRLWTTRLLSYLSLYAFRFSLRSPNDKNQKDKLCLNMWLDEHDLVWRERNIYTSHEIAQILPLVNKDKTYEKFLYKNKWILEYWPNAVRINEEGRVKSEKVFSSSFFAFTLRLVEKIAFWLQYRHMRSKISREVISPTRALFHPQDWGKVVMGRLSP